MVDTMIRIGSIVVALILVLQFFGAKGGSLRHNRRGKVAMVIGFLLLIPLTIRGSQLKEVNVTWMLAMHLITGSLFLVSFFAAGFLGWRAEKTGKGRAVHRMMACSTAIFLALSLALGSVAYFAHHNVTQRTEQVVQK
jgi:hypothetical protein